MTAVLNLTAWLRVAGVGRHLTVLCGRLLLDQVQEDWTGEPALSKVLTPGVSATAALDTQTRLVSLLQELVDGADAADDLEQMEAAAGAAAAAAAMKAAAAAAAVKVAEAAAANKAEAAAPVDPAQ